MSVIPALALFLLTQTSQPADRPPRLDFKNPPDYIAWYNEFVSRKSIANNANDLYSTIEASVRAFGDQLTQDENLAREFEQCQRAMWSTHDYPKIAAALDQQKENLLVFKKATALESCWIPDHEKPHTLFDIQMQNLACIRRLNKIVLAQAHRDQANPANAILDAAGQVLRGTRHLSKTRTLIGQLASNFDRAIAYDALRAAFTDGTLSDKNAQQTLDALRKNDYDRVPFRDPCILEWASALSVLKDLCPDGKLDYPRWRHFGKTDGEKDEHNLILELGLRAKIRFDPQKMTREVDDYYENLVQMTPAPLTLDAIRELEQFETARKATYNAEDNAFMLIFAPPLTRGCILEYRMHAKRRATYLTVALFIHHAQTGKWPARLDDIKAVSVQDYRTDPYSGKDFIYKLKDGKPLLYSVGVDGKDNGGETHDGHFGERIKNSDYIFFPIPPKP